MGVSQSVGRLRPEARNVKIADKAIFQVSAMPLKRGLAFFQGLKLPGHKAAIAEEATGDEASLLHKVALFDVAHKYADVMSLDEILSELRRISNSR